MRLIFAEHVFGGDFEIPPAGRLFNLPGPDFFGTPFSRVFLLVALSVVLVCLFYYLAFRNAKVVPGKLQSIAEMVIEFVDQEIAMQVIGPKGKPFVPLLTAMFSFILVNNVFEVIPFISFPTMSRIGFPAALAIITYVVFIATAIRHQGLQYFKEALFPPGVPKALYILLTPLEFFSTFVMRPVTLAIRLFANMVAGHMLLTILFLASWAFIRIPGLAPADTNYWLNGVGLITFVASPVIVMFELFIAGLQAYIFAILTAVYIQGSVESAH